MGNLGMWEILVILLVVLLLFGAKRLPEMGSSIGKGIREFKNSVTGNDEDEEPREIERESADERTRPLEGEVVHNRKN